MPTTRAAYDTTAKKSLRHAKSATNRGPAAAELSDEGGYVMAPDRRRSAMSSSV